MLSLIADTIWLLCVVVFSVAEAVLYTLYPKPKKSIRGETAVVTGAGHGIGREYALQLARLGARVVCWDINPTTCEKTKNEIESEGGTAWNIVCDVSDRETVAKAAKETREVAGQVSILVNNAGVLTGRPILRLKPEEIRRDFAINVFSQYWTILEFLPDMHRADHGHILSMSSTAATAGVPYNSIYCATKFANKGMMESLYLEQRQDAPTCRVKWTTVLPFVVNTGMAYEPRTRFPFFMPIVEPEECARTAIDALLRDEEECFVPPRLRLSVYAAKVFPRRAQIAILDYFDCFMGYKPE